MPQEKKESMVLKDAKDQLETKVHVVVQERQAKLELQVYKVQTACQVSVVTKANQEVQDQSAFRVSQDLKAQ